MTSRSEDLGFKKGVNGFLSNLFGISGFTESQITQAELYGAI